MIKFFLVLALLGDLNTKPPEMIAPYKTLLECEKDALQLNKSRSPEQLAKGVAAVCLQIVGPAA